MTEAFAVEREGMVEARSRNHTKALIPFRSTKPGTEPPRQTALRDPTGPPPPTRKRPGITPGDDIS